MEKVITKDKPVLLFDGVCNFCNSSVNFIIDRNSQNNIYFASLQSDTGQKLLKEFNLPTETFNSLVFVKDGKFYTKSTAALKIAKMLDGAWKFLFLTVIVPKFFRDYIYDIIAKNRYKWFGKMDQCRIPTKEIRDRFLE